MTTNDTTAAQAEAAQEPADTIPAAEGAPAEQPSDQPKEANRPANAEAARYRTRLRETEAERDTLLSAVDTYRRRDVERVAEAAGMARGADLFDVGHELGDLLGDDGTVNPAKVAEVAAAVLVERPHWAVPGPPRPKPDPAQGGYPGRLANAPTWQQLLSGRDG
jgi:hypothetical protein